MKKSLLLFSSNDIDDYIYLYKGHPIMLDVDLAVLYQVTVKRLKEQVKRNLDRFTKDFLFKLRIEETNYLKSSRSQIATLKRGNNTKYGSYAFGCSP